MQAVKELVARQLDEAMKKHKISKNKMATLLKTSRTQVDRHLLREDHRETRSKDTWRSVPRGLAATEFIPTRSEHPSKISYIIPFFGPWVDCLTIAWFKLALEFPRMISCPKL